MTPKPSLAAWERATGFTVKAVATRRVFQECVVTFGLEEYASNAAFRAQALTSHALANLFAAKEQAEEWTYTGFTGARRTAWLKDMKRTQLTAECELFKSFPGISEFNKPN